MIRIPLIGCGCAIAAMLGMAGLTLMWWIYFKKCWRRSIKTSTATIRITRTSQPHHNPFIALLKRKPRGWEFVKQFYVEWHRHKYFTITTPAATTLNQQNLPYSNLEVSLPPEQNDYCTIPIHEAEKGDIKC